MGITIFRPGRRVVIPSPGVQVWAPGVSAAGSGALLTNLISFWELEEASGTRNDSYGTNHLTSNNSVGQVAGKVGQAANFTVASSMYLSCADNVSLSTGDIDFTLCAWVRLASKPINATFFAKGTLNAVSTDEFALYYNQGSDRFRFFVVNSAGSNFGIVSANNLGSPSLSTWYHVVAWHDASADTLNIQINNGVIDSVSHTTGSRDGTNDFQIGYGRIASSYMSGDIDQAGFWKRILTSDERTWLYNSGNGRSYAEIAAY